MHTENLSFDYYYYYLIWRMMERRWKWEKIGFFEMQLAFDGWSSQLKCGLDFWNGWKTFITCYSTVWCNVFIHSQFWKSFDCAISVYGWWPLPWASLRAHVRRIEYDWLFLFYQFHLIKMCRSLYQSILYRIYSTYITGYVHKGFGIGKLLNFIVSTKFLESDFNVPFSFSRIPLPKVLTCKVKSVWVWVRVWVFRY